ncbi:hypothetical protein FE391_41180 [Nonomuraea sp. KC401]|uniref:hypothetical protein n=1 Tax=unclassified Nonomuraea TaxID=2593643 RepID=UPI0010FDC273|nr:MULTISPECIES: hypothetical protein [unclassified Nonomuraea]NBE99946.1 hypothetical protein [Nonomuraea sp. K271]TLF54941.1 hypothetical protein FE391_41180 [Nonomuraea sp. KC401]
MLELFDDDPISRPLTYPGRIPAASGVLADDAYMPLQPQGDDPGEWGVAGEPLSALLAHRGCLPLTARHRVVAVGSNAAPSQLRRKFLGHGVRPVVPMTLADVPGIAPGVSAHVSRWGYVPAAPIDTPGETSRLFVLWLDERQLAALDLTEPNYTRRTLTHPVRLEPGPHLPPPFVYAGKHGCVLDEGRPRRLTPQRALIQSLLDEIPGLRQVCGDTPDDFVAGVKDESVRATASLLLQAERSRARAAG